MTWLVAEQWTADDVEQRLEEAIDTLRRLPDRERGMLRSMRSHWPDVVRDWADVWGEAVAAGQFRAMSVHPGAPDAAAIDRMDETLPWLGWLDHQKRRVVWARINGANWWVIAGLIRKGERTARRRYEDGLSFIAARLNARQKNS